MSLRKKIAFCNLPTRLLLLIRLYDVNSLIVKLFAAFNFVSLITGKESVFAFTAPLSWVELWMQISRCGVKCRWKAGSDFPRGSLINSYILSGCTSWSNREINKRLDCFILFFFFLFLKAFLRLRFTEGNNTGSWPKNKRKKGGKNNRSPTFIWTGSAG